MAGSPEVAPSFKINIAISNDMVTMLWELVNVRLTGCTRKHIDTTHLNTAQPDVSGGQQFGGRTYIPAPLADPGFVEGDIHFNPDDDPLINAGYDADGLPSNETCTITWLDLATDATWSAEGFVTDYEVDATENDKMTGRVRIKLSGIVTIIDGVTT